MQFSKGKKGNLTKEPEASSEKRSFKRKRTEDDEGYCWYVMIIMIAYLSISSCYQNIYMQLQIIKLCRYLSIACYLQCCAISTLFLTGTKPKKTKMSDSQLTKKEIEKKRKMSKKNYELGSKAKGLWEQLRRLQTTSLSSIFSLL